MWESVRVTPASGTTACLGMLFATYLDLGFRRVRPGAVARPHGAATGAVTTSSDTRLCESGLDELFANFHIVGKRPR